MSGRYYTQGKFMQVDLPTIQMSRLPNNIKLVVIYYELMIVE